MPPRRLPGGSGSATRTAARHLPPGPALWPEVEAGLRRGWSPEQVAGMLKRMHPDDPTRRVSHETIYAHIYAYPRGQLRTDLIALLRQSHKTRRPRARGEDRRGPNWSISGL